MSRIRDIDLECLAYADGDAVPDALLDQSNELTEELLALAKSQRKGSLAGSFAMVAPDDCPANRDIGPKG